MRSFIVGFVGLVLVVALMPASAPAGSPAAEGDRAAIIAVIRRQLDAFRADRGAEAFSYTSPAIQRLFGTAERYMEAIRYGYGAVYRPRAVHFLGLDTAGGRVTQRVLLVGPEGAMMASYAMERQPGGEWRIDGCMLEKPDDRPA